MPFNQVDSPVPDVGVLLELQSWIATQMIFCLVNFACSSLWKKQLYRHSTACKFRSAGAPQKGFISTGRSLSMGSVYADESRGQRELQTVVISRMRIDRITKAATSDPQLWEQGQSSCESWGRDVPWTFHQHGKVGLVDYITGSRFDKVTEAVEEGQLYVH